MELEADEPVRRAARTQEWNLEWRRCREVGLATSMIRKEWDRKPERRDRRRRESGRNGIGRVGSRESRVGQSDRSRRMS